MKIIERHAKILLDYSSVDYRYPIQSCLLCYCYIPLSLDHITIALRIKLDKTTKQLQTWIYSAIYSRLSRNYIRVRQKQMQKLLNSQKRKLCTNFYTYMEQNWSNYIYSLYFLLIAFCPIVFLFRPQLACYFVSFWQRPIPYFQDSYSSPSIILFRGDDKYIQNFGR